jgi:hypothetical protein
MPTIAGFTLQGFARQARQGFAHQGFARNRSDCNKGAKMIRAKEAGGLADCGADHRLTGLLEQDETAHS